MRQVRSYALERTLGSEPPALAVLAWPRANAAVVGVLLQAGADRDIDAEDHDRMTPYDCALHWWYVDTAWLLASPDLQPPPIKLGRCCGCVCNIFVARVRPCRRPGTSEGIVRVLRRYGGGKSDVDASAYMGQHEQ